LSARSDEAELAVAVGRADADVGGSAACDVAAVAAVDAGLAIGVSVEACANKPPASASEQIQRRNDFFIGYLIIGCSKRPIWIQRSSTWQGN